MLWKTLLKTYNSEKGYIRKRKWKALGSRLIFCLCRVFPIRPQLVSVCTFEGKGGFGCNPKYIVEELHRKNPEIKFVWLVNKNVYKEKVFPNYIKKVPNTLFSRAYWLTVSKVWIDNYRKPYGTIKRKGQYYLNTWHACEGFKAIGLLRGEKFSNMAYLVSKNDSDMIDLVTVDSCYLADMYRKGLIYSGNYLKVGQCRCDVLYGDRNIYRKEFRKRYNLPLSSHVVMFAPTFREINEHGKRRVFAEEISLDFRRVLTSLEKRFGGEWFWCVRTHPQLKIDAKKIIKSNMQDKIIDVSQVDDMYEILAAMDVFITDYSSTAFDAGLCRMPVFLYADDIKEFSKDRGGLLWNLSENTDGNVTINDQLTPGYSAILPYPIAKDNNELEERILAFNQTDYENKLNKMEYNLGIVFDGEASVKIAEHIIMKMEIGVKK